MKYGLKMEFVSAVMRKRVPLLTGGPNRVATTLKFSDIELKDTLMCTLVSAPGKGHVFSCPDWCYFGMSSRALW